MNKPIDFCRHFNGILNKHCKFGVLYDHIRDDSVRPCRLPCIDSDAITCCLHREEYTAVEREAQEAKYAEFMRDMESGICPHCKSVITSRQRIGRCLYASPCGHRLGQTAEGKVQP